MKCRAGCGACCIAPSISSPIPGAPEGKPPGIRCLHLTSDNKCGLFNQPQRPKICIDFLPSPQICGANFQDALHNLTRLEILTRKNPAT